MLSSVISPFQADDSSCTASRIKWELDCLLGMYIILIWYASCLPSFEVTVTRWCHIVTSAFAHAAQLFNLLTIMIHRNSSLESATTARMPTRRSSHSRDRHERRWFFKIERGRLFKNERRRFWQPTQPESRSRIGAKYGWKVLNYTTAPVYTSYITLILYPFAALFDENSVSPRARGVLQVIPFHPIRKAL
jgi:hypothetical protein